MTKRVPDHALSVLLGQVPEGRPAPNGDKEKREMDALAEVRLSCGRQYLSVAGFVLAMEGDKCRDGEIPEEYMPPIPPEELERATIGGKPVKDMDIKMVRFFRGDNWTPKMMEYVAEQINRKAST